MRVLVVGVSDPFARDVVEAVKLLGADPILCDPVSSSTPWGEPATRLDLLSDEDRATAAVIGDSIFPDLIEVAMDAQMMETQIRLRRLALEAGIRSWLTVVHPSAVVYSTASLGEGAYVSANATIASSSVIGRHARINRNAAVGHDVTVADGAQIGPGAALTSGCHLGEDAFVGAAATILNRVRLGARSSAAAGSVVTRDIPAGMRAMGNPARVVGAVSE